MEYYFWRFE